MHYSDVVKANMILPKKQNYTMRDANSLLVSSLFNGGKTLSESEAKFIVKCSAIYHGTNYSKQLAKHTLSII